VKLDLPLIQPAKTCRIKEAALRPIPAAEMGSIVLLSIVGAQVLAQEHFGSSQLKGVFLRKQAKCWPTRLTGRSVEHVRRVTAAPRSIHRR
jgi:hypothetical protein